MTLLTRAYYHDAHTHLSAGAVELLGLDLRTLHVPRFLDSVLADAAACARPGSWVRGWGWDGTTAIADVRSSVPVFVARRDGHAAWTNRAARAALGLSPFQPLVAESEFDAARKKLPPLSTEEKVSELSSNLDDLFLHGVGQVDDMVEPWAPEIYALARERRPGFLVPSVGMWLPEELDERDAEAMRREFAANERQLAVRGIKLFLDGTLGARTAALWAPYADDPGNAGTLRIPEGELEARVSLWTERGFAVAIHALGDRAVTLALDVLERAPRSAMGPHRIEHAQVVRRSDLPRFAAAGIVASVQPGHWQDDRAWLDARLGRRPEAVVHPLASLARAGATLLFGSDWPVSDYEPRRVLNAATDSRRGDEAMSAAEASAWYTSRPR